MPPKKQKASKKTVEKAKAKVIEDKTFGLKNKNKSKQVQKYIKAVTNTVQQSNVKRSDAREEEKRKKAKADEEQRKKELAEIFRATIIQPKVPPGVDPKSILCEFHKHGQCQKGWKCKFSHDLNIERKAAKIDLYTDKRGDDKKEDKMDDWDDNKLSQVVQEKHGKEKTQNKTDKVCKYFLDAVEKRLYGWFWVCPNGGDTCMYRHCLPPGFKLKEVKKEDDSDDEDEDDKITLEEQIEEERAKLVGGTPVTLESFTAWKKKKAEEKEKEVAQQKKKDDDAKKGGKKPLSGRDLFTFDPSMFVDDDEALSDTELVEDHSDEKVISATATSLSLKAATETGDGEGKSGDGEVAAVSDAIQASLFTADADDPELNESD